MNHQEVQLVEDRSHAIEKIQHLINSDRYRNLWNLISSTQLNSHEFNELINFLIKFQKYFGYDWYQNAYWLRTSLGSSSIGKEIAVKALSNITKRHRFATNFVQTFRICSLWRGKRTISLSFAYFECGRLFLLYQYLPNDKYVQCLVHDVDWSFIEIFTLDFLI